MVNDFYGGMKEACTQLEELLNRTKADYIAQLKNLDPALIPLVYTHCRHIKITECMEKMVIFPNQAINYPFYLHSREVLAAGTRVPIQIENGYLAKITPMCEASNPFCFCREYPSVTLLDKMGGEYTQTQERLVALLRDFGFIEENGFKVADHHTVAISTGPDGTVRVTDHGSNELNFYEHGFKCTITEDLTRGGYTVEDIRADHFHFLHNGSEFLESYLSYMGRLTAFFQNPKIAPKIARHESRLADDDLKMEEAISRMLLAQIRDGIGSIFIGDVNNILIRP